MKILYVSKWADACSYYRMISPSKHLNREEGIEVRNCYFQKIHNNPLPGLNEKDAEWADIIVFQRPITPQEDNVISQLKKIRPEKVVLGEYDDDYPCVPHWNPGYTLLRAKHESWKRILKNYDGITVSTENLKSSIQNSAKSVKANPDVRVIKNAIDFEEFYNDFQPVLNHPICKPVLKESNNDVVISQENWGNVSDFITFCEDKIVIGWFGSRTHFFDLEWIIKDLGVITERHKDVVVLFLGFLNFRVISEVDYDQLFMTQGITPTSKYYHLLQTLPIDISLCPVDPCEFNKSKSNIKYLESCASKFVPVCSEFDTYETDFHSGFLAGYRHGDWETKLEQAIELVRSKRHYDLLLDNLDYVKSKHDVKYRVPDYLSYYRDRLSFVQNGRV